MQDDCKIYIERLRKGVHQQIKTSLSATLMDINEAELTFASDIDLKGEAYLAEDELILHVDAKTQAIIPCAICNKPVSVDVGLENYYYAQPLSEIKGGIFDFSTLIRDELLIETPHYVECGNGKCPERTNIKNFLKDKSDISGNGSGQKEGQQPFADLDLT